MLRLRKIAVTGGLACGKSTVCHFFKEFGAYVVSADEIVHQLLSSDTTLGQRVIKLIGSDIVVNGEIDRSLIAKKVFNQPKKLRALEKLLHPIVLQISEKLYKKLKRTGCPLFVIEMPLLFEAGYEKHFDAVIAVIADPNLCLQRFAEATGKGAAEYTKRMQQQIDPLEKSRRAEFTVVNNGTLNDLKESVKKLFYKLKKGV